MCCDVQLRRNGCDSAENGKKSSGQHIVGFAGGIAVSDEA